MDVSSVSVSHSVSKGEGNKEDGRRWGRAEGSWRDKALIKCKKNRSTCDSPVKPLRTFVCWTQWDKQRAQLNTSRRNNPKWLVQGGLSGTHRGAVLVMGCFTTEGDNLHLEKNALGLKTHAMHIHMCTWACVQMYVQNSLDVGKENKYASQLPCFYAFPDSEI